MQQYIKKKSDNVKKLCPYVIGTWSHLSIFTIFIKKKTVKKLLALLKLLLYQIRSTATNGKYSW